MKLSQAEIEARLLEVRLSYVASLVEKRDTMLAQWTALCTHWQQDTFQSLYLIVHSLAGSAETFGLADITHDARKLVEQFKRHTPEQPFDTATSAKISADMDQLVASMNDGLSEINNKEMKPD